ncbi:hypothetical protein IU471_27915, partial [Nocardia elegans]|uniref:hypothetical protein n=1 Tax=Nocardia elegans TaxID=300029 RepID=UPI001894FD6E
MTEAFDERPFFFEGHFLEGRGMTQLPGHRSPGPIGLYDPANEHDACGVAFVVDMHGRRSRDIVDKAITAL